MRGGQAGDVWRVEWVVERWSWVDKITWSQNKQTRRATQYHPAHRSHAAPLGRRIHSHDSEASISIKVLVSRLLIFMFSSGTRASGLRYQISLSENVDCVIRCGAGDTLFLHEYLEVLVLLRIRCWNAVCERRARPWLDARASEDP